MIIRALSVFEGIVYHCVLIDGSNPTRPQLEVEAVVRPGDTDAGPLLLPLADYVILAGGNEAAAPAIERFRQQERLVDHLGVAHLAFPFWTPVLLDQPPGRPPADGGEPEAAPHPGEPG